VWCSVLQCVAVCCSVLQCVAVCGSVSQCVLQCAHPIIITTFSTLQATVKISVYVRAH